MRSGSASEDAKPALRSLPAAGELLVESEQGPWIVREDGSKRLLGDYDEATWSPRGPFVAVDRGPRADRGRAGRRRRAGRSPPRPGSRDPRWAPSGFEPDRLPQRRRPLGGRGDGTRRAADRPRRRAGGPGVAPASASRRSRPGRAAAHVLTYLDATAEWTSTPSTSTPASGADGQRRTSSSCWRRDRRAASAAAPTRSPDGRSIAAVRPSGPRDRARRCSGRRRPTATVLFSRPRRLTGPDLVARRPLAAGRLARGRPVAVHPGQRASRPWRRARRLRPDLRAVRPRRQPARAVPERLRLGPAGALSVPRSTNGAFVAGVGSNAHLDPAIAYGSGGSRSWCAGVKKLR